MRSIIASAPVERPAAVPIPYDGLTEEFTDEVARLADDAPGIREAVSAALENSNAIIAPQGNAAPAPAGERAALVERVLGMFEAWPKDEPGPTHEPESQYRLGYNTALEDVLTAIDAGAPIRRAASANETDDYETRRKVAEALGIVWPGTRDGKRTGFAWSYLLGCIKDLSSDVRHIYGAYGDACARASANETGAEGAAVAWMRIDDPRDCISDAKKRDMIEHAGAPGARLAENYSIALGKIGPAQAAEPVAWDFRMISRDVPADWHRCASKVHADELRKPDYAGVIEVRDLFDAPQPTGQADAREGLTDEQREAIEYAARWLEENVSNRYAYTAAKQLRALLQGANHAE
ncbi:hypothetical protein BDAG_01700 [Burkholderia dolosa AU0158]|nr:hypothetical protein EGY28_27265 [Burkholderia dolosa]EAY68962.1 hypothetical protein BDAG_01700 [Burkholderia dolosa AU0158]